jgi:RimJ/RimL family protein N-acetyltransferase
MPTLETERLTIRLFTLDHLDAAHAMLDIHPDVWHFDPGYSRTREQRTIELQYRIWQYEREGFGQMAVILKNHNTLIGYVGLQTYILPTEPLATPEVEMFYKFGRDYWGQGYATEACRAMLRHAFEDLHLTRIVTVTHKDNANSIALLKRLGITIVAAPPKWADDVLGILENPLT